MKMLVVVYDEREGESKFCAHPLGLLIVPFVLSQLQRYLPHVHQFKIGSGDDAVSLCQFILRGKSSCARDDHIYKVMFSLLTQMADVV